MQSDSRIDSKSLDIVFISYDESNSDKNWLELKARFPRAKRVHGVQGIKQAHQKAAETSQSNFFFVVDGDNRIRPDFNFEVDDFELKQDSIYVYRCVNPANGLSYGFGAVKIYNKSLIAGRDPKEKYVDLATTVTTNYRIVSIKASETYFFNTEKEAWRGAFRECAKLAAGIIARQNDKETQERLDQWCVGVRDVPNKEWILMGARQGRDFGKNYPDQLSHLNDFNWLDRKFDEFTKTSRV